MTEYSTDARVEVRARQKFFHQLILHDILHRPDILNVSLSLKLIGVNDFDVNEI